MPRGGTWFCLKTFIGKVRNAKTIRALLRERTSVGFGSIWRDTLLCQSLRLVVRCNDVRTKFTRLSLRSDTSSYLIRRAKTALIASLPYLESSDNKDKTFELIGDYESFMLLTGNGGYRITASGMRNVMWYTNHGKVKTPGFEKVFWFA